MLTEYHILRPGAQPETDWVEAPSLDAIRALVTPIVGPLIEHVAVLSEHGRCSMFVSEIGHLEGLPFNELATKIYRAWTLSQQPNLDPDSLHWIAGPAILFERNVWY